MLFQNTSVTRGTGTMVVTATGMQTQMGQIATMLTSVTRTRSPLQKELDTLTKVLGIIAWGAVAVIVVVGSGPRHAGRGRCCCWARRWRSRRSRPACRRSSPGCCRYGAKQLAEAKAVVKNLTDVETLGATSAINTDKTGTLTMNQMMVSTLYADGSWFTVEGEGYAQDRARSPSVAGAPVPDFTRLALGLALDSDAIVGDDGAVIGDPTEAALVVLAAKLGRRRRGDPARLPAARRGAVRLRVQVHGDVPPRHRSTAPSTSSSWSRARPDVVLARCTHVGRPAQRLAGADRARRGPASTAANERMGEKGLRVLAFAARLVDDDELAAMADDPMSLDPGPGVRRHGRASSTRCAPRPRARCTIALRAGIDVRMITGDHAVTAQAIGETLGLGPGAISGAELQALSDEELRAPAARAARVRPGHARGQAAAGPAHAGAGPDRRDDRRRGQRRRRAQAGRHRGGDGQRQRGHQAGRAG